MAIHAGWLLVSAVFWLMVLAGLALLVVWVARARPPSPTPHASTRETPLEILARRFAAGEINADEYERSRDLLTGSGH